MKGELIDRYGREKEREERYGREKEREERYGRPACTRRTMAFIRVHARSLQPSTQRHNYVGLVLQRALCSDDVSVITSLASAM